MGDQVMPTITIYDAESGEVTTREMNADELAVYEADQAAFAAEVNRKAQQAAKRQELLDKLGITEEEAQLLLAK